MDVWLRARVRVVLNAKPGVAIAPPRGMANPPGLVLFPHVGRKERDGVRGEA